MMSFNTIETIQLTLPSETVATLNQLIESGAYHSQADIVCDALSRLQLESTALHRTDELRMLYAEGKASGAPVTVSLEELLNKIHKRTDP